MNVKTTIFLVVVVLILGAIWFLLPAPQKQEPIPTEPAPKTAALEPLFSPAPAADKIRRVEVARPGKPKLVFTRPAGPTTEPGPSEWQMQEPVAATVEGYTVQGLVSALTGLQSRSQFEPGTAGDPNLADAGLESPIATVTLTGDADKTYKLEIGKNAPLSTDTYVRIAGEKTVHVVNRDLLPDVRKELNDYRAKRVAQFKVDDAVGLKIEYQGATYDLAKGADGEWVINAPVRAYADRDKVRALITKLTSLRVEEFVDDAPSSPATYGLDSPYLTFTVATETKRPLPAEKPEKPETESQPTEPKFETVTGSYGVVIGGTADLKGERRYLRLATSPWVASVTEANVKNLVPNLKELRDPRITRIKSPDVTRIELDWPGATPTTAVLQKTDGTWRGSADLAELEVPAVVDLLQAIEDLRAIDYVDTPQDGATYGLDKPRTVITVTSSGAVAPLTLRIGAETESKRNAYVQRGNESGVLVVTAVQAARLAVGPLALRSRAIFDFPYEQIRTLHVQREPIAYTVAHDGPLWKLTQPAGARNDPGAVRRMSEDLAHLRAKNVVAKDDAARFGLDAPAATLNFEIVPAPESQPTTAESQPAPEAPPIPHTLALAWKDGACYAQKDNDPYVYELDETVFRTLTAELLDTRVFNFTPDQAIGIKIVSTGGTLEFTKVGDQWKYAPDPFVELPQKKIQDFARELSDLRAERFLAYGTADLDAAGLVNTPASLTIKLNNDREVVLKMTQEKPGELPRKAAVEGHQNIFRLKQEDVEKLMRGLDEYLKVDTPAPAEPGAPGAPGAPGMPGQPPRPPTAPKPPPKRPQP